MQAPRNPQATRLTDRRPVGARFARLVRPAIDAAASTLLDARVSQDLGLGRAGLRLFVGVENILNEGDSDHLPIAPRTTFVGLTGRYPTKTNTGAQ